MVGARAQTWAGGTRLVPPVQPISIPCHVPQVRASEPMLWVHLRPAQSLVWGNIGTMPPYQCDSMSVCAFRAFTGGWGAYAPIQGCCELSLHAELSPGSLLQGAATYWPGSALCNSNAGCFPGRTNGLSTCPALQLVLWLLPSHVHLQQRHCGLSGQGADGHPCQPARDHDRDVSMAPHHHLSSGWLKALGTQEQALQLGL